MKVLVVAIILVAIVDISVLSVLAVSFGPSQRLLLSIELTDSPELTQADWDLETARSRLGADRGILVFNAPYDLDSWLEANATYISDTNVSDCWKAPSEFLSDGGGDCEDYVLFAMATLNSSTFEFRICMGKLGDNGHAYLLATRIHGHSPMYLIDTSGVRNIDVRSWYDPSFLPKDYHTGAVLDSNFNYIVVYDWNYQDMFPIGRVWQ